MSVNLFPRFSLFMTSAITYPGLDSEPFQLNCLLLGESRTHTFSVGIQAKKAVGAFNKAIKEEKRHAFDHVDADTLIL